MSAGTQDSRCRNGRSVHRAHRKGNCCCYIYLSGCLIRSFSGLSPKLSYIVHAWVSDVDCVGLVYGPKNAFPRLILSQSHAYRGVYVQVVIM